MSSPEMVRRILVMGGNCTPVPHSTQSGRSLATGILANYCSRSMSDINWPQSLLPLPQEFCVTGSRRIPAAAIHVRVRDDEPSLQEGARILCEAIGADHRQPARLTIDIATMDGFTGDNAPTDSESGQLQLLARLPNAAQSYQIHTISDERIIIAGHTPVGGLYGALTMAQLLTAGKGRDRIEVPLVDIVDWPDIEERGLWNFPDAAEWIPWMASMKLNYGKMADTHLSPVRRGRRNTAAIDVDLMQMARGLGFRYLPFIVHLNFLHDVGLYQAYPELAGKGDAALAGRYYAHKQGNQHRAPCASQPRLVEILSQWLDSIARQGADEISCWLSERPCQCECEACTPAGQFLLETRAFLAAWRQQLSAHPGLRLRIFSSTTTPEQDDLILRELPPEIRFERACASGMERVAHQPRDLFANPLLDEAAAQGRWVASYDVPIGAYGNVDTPETKLPQYSAQRIQDYVTQLHGRHYSGAYGMLAWGTQARSVCGFAIAALAEYAWNGQGRPVEEFATAWATREGRHRPQAVGRWAALLGEIEFDIYDGGFPTGYTWGETADMVVEGRPPRLSEGIYHHFHALSDFATHLATCRRAQAGLDKVHDRDLILATDVVASYVGLAQAIWTVAHEHAHGDLQDVTCQRRLEDGTGALVAAGERNTAAIADWRRNLGEEPWQHRVHDAIQATSDTVRRITDHIRHQHLDLI
ncbi:MAG: hypothetical protein HN712_20375 [Gemmatimonadetes bacterium]|nr:hypothetical protein [Gemmatimonadota bacterium]